MSDTSSVDPVMPAKVAAAKDGLAASLLELETLLATDNAVIRDNPAPSIKVIARAVRRLVRIALLNYEPE